MNFAHGELYMLGAYAGIAVIGVTHSFWVALLAAPLLVGGVAAVTEMAALRPLYRREPLYGLILTFGLALVFREGARQIWGGDMRRILPPVTGSTPLLGMTYPNYRLFLLGASRSEEHTSELQSRLHLVCRLLLEKKNRNHQDRIHSIA